VAEYKVRALQLHPDKQRQQQRQQGPSEASNTEEGQTGEQGTAALNEAKFQTLQRAYECLSNDNERRLYDEYLGAGMKMSFEKWKVLKGQGHVSHDFLFIFSTYPSRLFVW